MIMLIRTCHGLCNQIRAALSYLQIARRQRQPLYVLWSVSVACPAKYSDLFEPIEGMHVIYSLEELGPRLEHPQRDLQQLPPETWLRMRGDNCGITEIIVTPKGQASLGRFADTGHLSIEQTTFH